MSEWQPIETAPRDGTRFIASKGPDDDRPEFVEWTTHRPEGGWYNGDWTYDSEDFTHWMPTPAPPKFRTVECTNEIWNER